MRVTGLSEFLIYGLLFLAIIGFNLFKQIIGARRDQARRQKRQAPNQETAELSEPMDYRSESPPEPVTREIDLAQDHWGRAPDPEPNQVPEAIYEPMQPQELVLARQMAEPWHDDNDSSKPARPTARSASSSRRHSGRKLIRDRGELRHGIVLMTVLGPCRALQPYDQDQH